MAEQLVIINYTGITWITNDLKNESLLWEELPITAASTWEGIPDYRNIP